MGRQTTNVLTHSGQPSLRHRLFKRPITTGLIGIIYGMQKILSEEVQLHGCENLYAQGELFPGPRLWVVKHESFLDVVNFVPYWLNFPPRPDFRSAIRVLKKEEKVLRALDSLVLRHFTYHVNRTSMGESASLEEQQRLRAENEEHFEKTRDLYYKGVDAIIFPEGTTRTDGTIFPIKAGCYNLAKIEKRDGAIDVVTCVPIGLTYDLISGDQHWLFRKIHRNHAFVNIGKPFHYQPTERDDGETEMEYRLRDIKAFTNSVRDAFLTSNTITVAQLAGEYLLRQAYAGDSTGKSSEREVEDAVSLRVDQLSQLPDITFDNLLLEKVSLTHRVEQFWKGLELRGYRQGDDLNLGKFRHLPEMGKYKRENPLLYCVNRIRQVGAWREEIGDILRQTYHQMH